MATQGNIQPINNSLLIPSSQGNKSIRTPAQLEMLAKARVKALEIRKFNASVKEAERQTKAIQETNLKKEVLNKYKKLIEPEPEPEPEKPEPEKPEPEKPEKREIILMKKPKVAKKAKIVYYTDSEEEEEPQPPPILVKKPRPPLPQSAPIPIPCPVPIQAPRFRNPLTGR
jgi:hypothetical protein